MSNIFNLPLLLFYQKFFSLLTRDNNKDTVTMKGKNKSYQRNMCACTLTKCVFRGKSPPLHLHVLFNSAGCLLAGCPSYNSIDKALCLLGESVFILVEKDRQQSNVTGTLLH